MSELIGYYSLEQTNDKKGYLGAILVIDKKGIPQEFRVTHSIKPTVIQKQLYGESLVEYIGVTLCGLPLYNSLKVKPKALIVNQKILLGIGDEINCFVAFAKNPGETYVLGENHDEETGKITSDNGLFKPLFVSYPQNYDQQKELDSQEYLQGFATSVDILEPFKRIKTALDALAEQENQFR